MTIELSEKKNEAINYHVIYECEVFFHLKDIKRAYNKIQVFI